MFFFGVDGGGSRTRVRLVDAEFRTLSTAEGGPANLHLAFDTALATIEDTLHRAAEAAGLGPGEVKQASLGLGLAGLSSPAIGDRVAARLSPTFGHVTARNDGVIACIGAHAGCDGGLVIAGTGSGAILRANGQDLWIGGRGFLLGDDGSGAVMGRAIWRRALRLHDGLEEPTPLLRDLMAEFGDDPVAVISWGRSATSSGFATYAPRIIDAAHAGDPAGLAVTHAAAAAIAELVAALASRNAPRISLVGGLALPLLPFLPEAARNRLRPPIYGALDGALFLAGAPINSGLGARREEAP